MLSGAQKRKEKKSFIPIFESPKELLINIEIGCSPT
jgi:hypothetical protein